MKNFYICVFALRSRSFGLGFPFNHDGNHCKHHVLLQSLLLALFSVSILHLYLEQFLVPQGVRPGQVIPVAQPNGQV
jgi:hypothetical protein